MVSRTRMLGSLFFYWISKIWKINTHILSKTSKILWRLYKENVVHYLILPMVCKFQNNRIEGKISAFFTVMWKYIWVCAYIYVRIYIFKINRTLSVVKNTLYTLFSVSEEKCECHKNHAFIPFVHQQLENGNDGCMTVPGYTA